MKSFNHYLPVKIVFGKGSLNTLHENLNTAKRIIIVTGKTSALKSGIIARLRSILSSGQVEKIVFTSVQSNPTIAEVNAIANEARRIEADFIVGIGGGSAMDAAKASAVLATNPRDFRDLIGMKRYEPAPLPLALIPTTAGTGSEVNQYAIITDDKANDKLNLSSENTYARIAILDPELSIGMPKEITIDTGIDALCHAIEGFISRRAVPISDTLAPPVFKLIRNALPLAVKDSSNLDARGKMLYAATLAGIVISHTGTTMVHAMGYPLTLKYGVSHGRANAALIAHGLRFNYSAAPEKIGDIYEVFGGERNADGVEAFFDFLHCLDIKTCLRDYGVEKEDLEGYKRYVIGRANVRNSPAEITEDGMAALLEEIY